MDSDADKKREEKKDALDKLNCRKVTFLDAVIAPINFINGSNFNTWPLALLWAINIVLLAIAIVLFCIFIYMKEYAAAAGIIPSWVLSMLFTGYIQSYLIQGFHCKRKHDKMVFNTEYVKIK